MSEFRLVRLLIVFVALIMEYFRDKFEVFVEIS